MRVRTLTSSHNRVSNHLHSRLGLGRSNWLHSRLGMLTLKANPTFAFQVGDVNTGVMQIQPVHTGDKSGLKSFKRA